MLLGPRALRMGDRRPYLIKNCIRIKNLKSLWHHGVLIARTYCTSVCCLILDRSRSENTSLASIEGLIILRAHCALPAPRMMTTKFVRLPPMLSKYRWQKNCISYFRHHVVTRRPSCMHTPLFNIQSSETTNLIVTMPYLVEYNTSSLLTWSIKKSGGQARRGILRPCTHTRSSALVCSLCCSNPVHVVASWWW